MMIPAPLDTELAFLSACVGAARLNEFVRICTVYGEFLYETNETLNLTAIPPEEFWSKHICDSVLALREVPDCFHGRIADVGCGAGFPSLPLAAARPDLTFTAIDSRGKKIAFLTEAAQKCGLNNLFPIHARANELAAQSQFRSAFSLITARAVAAAPVLIKECRNLLAPHGKLCIFRTEAQADGEMPDLMKTRATFTRTPSAELPGQAGTRLFLVISKK